MIFAQRSSIWWKQRRHQGSITRSLPRRKARSHPRSMCKREQCMALDSYPTHNLSPNPTSKETMLCGGLEVEDWPHARQVARLSLQLFKATQPLHELEPRAALLLERGALLHNAGMLVSPKAHHKHSFMLINQTPLPDVSEDERHEIACI